MAKKAAETPEGFKVVDPPNSERAEMLKTDDLTGDGGARTSGTLIRLPQVGDKILYTLGGNSAHAGEERHAVITKVFNAKEFVVQFNVSCAHPDDFPRNPNASIPNFPVAPNTAPYDESGKNGTWRFA